MRDSSVDNDGKLQLHRFETKHGLKVKTEPCPDGKIRIVVSHRSNRRQRTLLPKLREIRIAIQNMLTALSVGDELAEEYVKTWMFENEENLMPVLLACNELRIGLED